MSQKLQCLFKGKCVFVNQKRGEIFESASFIMENVPTLPSCACKLVLFISLLIENFMVFMGLERLIYMHLRELQSALPFFFSPELFIGGPRKYILFFCPLQGRVGVGWGGTIPSVHCKGGVR